MYGGMNNSSSEYLKSAVLTATPEQLQLMLYDGAIRFSRQARDAMSRQDWENSCEKLIRAQKILIQMQNGLKHDVNPQLCSQLKSLYQFVYSRLVDANMTHRSSSIDEALQILEHQRETWKLIVDRVQGETEPSNAPSAPLPPAVRPAKAGSISFEA